MNNYFGLKKEDYDVLIQASNRKGYVPSIEKLNALKSKYPNLSNDDATIVMKLINSPVRNTFTAYDVFNYLSTK